LFREPIYQVYTYVGAYGCLKPLFLACAKNFKGPFRANFRGRFTTGLGGGLSPGTTNFSTGVLTLGKVFSSVKVGHIIAPLRERSLARGFFPP